MNLIKLSELFEIKYGVNLELNKLEQCSKKDKNAINFVSRTEKNNGISAIVKKIDSIKPIPAGTISVAAGGSVMSSFLQPEPFYSGRDLYYLTPKNDMSDSEKVFYCLCIRSNKYRYNYGRQANRTLKDLMVPKDLPEWVNKFKNKIPTDIRNDYFSNKKKIKLPDIKNWKEFRYDELFFIERGRGPRKKDLTNDGKIPFVTSIDKNNGWSGKTKMAPFHKGNVISVNRNGSIGEAYYQPIPFCSTEDVHIFNAKFELNQYVAMFLISLIKKEKYRYNYGRKWGIGRMNNTIIKLPVTDADNPNWDLIEKYMQSLPFSKYI